MNENSPFHRTLCMKPDACSECDRLATNQGAAEPVAPSDAEILACFADTKADGQGAYMLAVGRAILALSQTTQPQAGAVECERCGLSPKEHTASHWCGNQSYTMAEPAAGEQAGAVGHWVETVIAWTAGGRVLDTPEEAKAMEARGFEVKELFTKTWSEVAAPGAAIAAREQEVPKWIDDPHDIEQGQMLNPAWLKLHGLTPAQAASREEAPATPQADWYGDKSPLHQMLCMHPDPCSECDRIAALKGMQPVERGEG